MAATAKYKKTTTTVKGGAKPKATSAKDDKKPKVCPRCGRPM